MILRVVDDPRWIDNTAAAPFRRKGDGAAVFQRSNTNGVYGPGHNGFFKSPDGTEDWIVYQANASPEPVATSTALRGRRSSPGTPTAHELRHPRIPLDGVGLTLRAARMRRLARLLAPSPVLPPFCGGASAMIKPEAVAARRAPK